MCNKRERVFQTAEWFPLPHNMVAFETLQKEFSALFFSKGAFLWDDRDWNQWREITWIMVDRSNKLMNPLWRRIHWFIWPTMIHVISDHWSWSGSSQRSAPKETAKFQPLLMQLLHWQFLIALCYHTSLLYFAFFAAHVATACSHWHSWYFHHNNHLQTCCKTKPSWKLSFPKNLPHARADKTEQV